MGDQQEPTPERSPEEQKLHKKVQKKLDSALADTFPASDPVSIVTSQHEEDWGADQPDDELAKPARDQKHPLQDAGESKKTPH
jgi:hypothetical protein